MDTRGILFGQQTGWPQVIGAYAGPVAEKGKQSLLTVFASLQLKTLPLV